MPATAVLIAAASALAALALEPGDGRELAAVVLVCLCWCVNEGIARSRERWAVYGAAESRSLLEGAVIYVAIVVALGNAFEIVWLSGLLPDVDGAALREAHATTRTGMLGVFMAHFGNRLAKLPSPWRLRDEPFDWHTVHRFTGRLWTLVGATLVVLALAPPAVPARRAVPWLVGGTLVVSVARKLTSVARYAAGNRPSLSR